MFTVFLLFRSPEDQNAVLARQQQAIVNQQAIIMVKAPSNVPTLGQKKRKYHMHLLIVVVDLIRDHLFVSQAQQMTMQAMAMVSSPVSSPPTSPITSPPMSPLLHHPPSPYAVIPPSPYANIPPSPYANFSPTPYTMAGILPSPYPPRDRQERTTMQPEAPPPPEPAALPQPGARCSDPIAKPSSTKTEPGQPKANSAAQVSNAETHEAKVQNDILYNGITARKHVKRGWVFTIKDKVCCQDDEQKHVELKKERKAHKGRAFFNGFIFQKANIIVKFSAT